MSDELGWPASPRRSGRRRNRAAVSSGVLLRPLLFGVGLGLLFGLTGGVTRGPLQQPGASPSVAAGTARPPARAAPHDNAPATVELCEEPTDGDLLRTGHRGEAKRRGALEFPPPGARVPAPAPLDARPIMIGFDRAAGPELSPPRADFVRRRSEAGGPGGQVTSRVQPPHTPGARLFATGRDGERGAERAAPAPVEQA
jgi:hypothetical protein